MLVLLFLISLSCCIQFFNLQNGEEYWFLLCAIAFVLCSSNQGQACKHNQRVFCTLLLLWVIVKTPKFTQRSLPKCFVWVTKSWGLGRASEQSSKLWVPLTRVLLKLHEISSHTIVQVIKLIMTLCFLPCKNVLTMHNPWIRSWSWALVLNVKLCTGMQEQTWEIYWKEEGFLEKLTLDEGLQVRVHYGRIDGGTHLLVMQGNSWVLNCS